MESKHTFTDDHGNVFHGDEATADAGAHYDAQQGLRQRFARERPKDFGRWAKFKAEAGKRFENDPRRKQKVAEFQEARRRGEAASLDLSAEWSRAVRPAHAPEGRAPREATNQRSRRPQRGERSSSSSSDDPDGDPEPHRFCPCCGSSIDDHRADAEFLNHTHQVRWLRGRDRAEREAVGDYLVEGRPPTLEPCCCGGGTYSDPEGDRVCMSCGRWVDPSRLRYRNGNDARFAEWLVHMHRPSDKPRPIPKRRWRDWQRRSDATPRTYFAHNDRGGRPKEVKRVPPAANS